MRRHGTAAIVLVLSVLPLGGVVWGQTHVTPQPIEEVGIEEKLGENVPLYLGFLEANGDSIYLRDVIDRPTVLTLVYYHCPSICMPLLNGVAEVVEKTDLGPGKDYNLLTVSFDPFDDPVTASRIKKNITASMADSLPDGAWRFMTADSVTIARITDAVGFRVKRVEKDFAHGTALIVLSPGGKVVRYLYGLSYMPFDLKMAVAEATEGKIGPSVSRVLRFCFSYDPEGRGYVFNVTRVVGALVVVFAAIFVISISIVGRTQKKEKRT